ncbi:MAG: hypothetical protein K9J13_07915 [Saprospiraceae bacterium]|nr:hypothetical protein [Saprospiraceae bacterium]
MISSVNNWEYKGVAVSGYYSNAFNSLYFYKTIDYLKKCGVNSIEIVITWYQDNYYSTEIYKHQQKSVDDLLLIKAIQYIHKQGLKVNLNAHVDTFPDKYGWRAKIVPKDVSQWFESYQLFIEHFLKVSIKYNVELFTVGTEFISLTRPEYYKYWSDLVSFIRNYDNMAFKGKLTYLADKAEILGQNEFFLGNNQPINVEAIGSEFWELFDYISMSAFYGVGNIHQATPDFGSIISDWKNKWIPRLENWKNNLNTEKKVLIGEIGYRSIDYSHRVPAYHSGQASKTTKDKFNQQLQTNCYEAMFQALNNVDWIDGIFLWEEEMKNPPSFHNLENTDFSIINKETAQIVRKYYGNFDNSEKIDNIQKTRKDKFLNFYYFVSYWLELNLIKLRKLLNLRR